MDGGAIAVATRSRGTPRTVNQHLRMIRDYAIVDGRTTIPDSFVDYVMNECNVDTAGFGTLDKLYLRALIEKFDGGPAGLTTLSSVVDEESDTIEETVEQYMLQKGFIKKTSRGRVATPRAIKHWQEGDQ
jgi:Holliday junction DNA helicase RuvB